MATGTTIVASVAVAQTPTHKKSAKSTKGSSSSTAHSSHASATTHSTASSSKLGAKSSATKTTNSKSSKKSSRSKKVKGQAAPTPERINEIQGALAKQGMFSGEPTGKWDDSTMDAMKKFQATNHLNPTGKLDAPTLQKLGFGSETAGIAAPTPPPNSTANRLLSRNAPKDPEPSDN
jgi:hypothetical protein